MIRVSVKRRHLSIRAGKGTMTVSVSGERKWTKRRIENGKCGNKCLL